MAPGADVPLVDTRCTICETEGNASELFAANLDASAFTAEVFSARRLPDRIHYRMVKCRSCGLIRSDPVLATEALAALYAESTFTYEAEVANLRATYSRYLRRAQAYVGGNATLLELGCGNGFMLEEAMAIGFKDARGVEPGQSTVDAAPPGVREKIVVDVMKPGLFPPASFDVVCLFQVLDHLPEPVAVLRECLEVLRPGGVVLCFNHNVHAMSARVLGEASPIIDIEHTYLYSKATMRRILTASGFQPREIGSAWNTLSLEHLTRLLPLPARLKARALSAAEQGRAGRFRVLLPLGNLFAIGQKAVSPVDTHRGEGVATRP